MEELEEIEYRNSLKRCRSSLKRYRSNLKRCRSRAA